jgi:tripartite ATP-independent transporter DctP family solute receptor
MPGVPLNAASHPARDAAQANAARLHERVRNADHSRSISPMNRQPTRAAFVTATAAAFASIAFVRAPARAAQFAFKSGTNQAPDHPLSVAMRDMCDAIRKETDGKLDITVFPNNQLGGDTAMLTQLRSGALQMMTLDGGIMSGVVPVAAIQSVGFAFKDPQQALGAMDGALGAYVRSEIESKGIHPFDNIWENGMRQITSSTKPIANLADLGNFKIRTPAAKISLDLFKELGASPTPINFSELYTALQTHVVDGQENPPANIMTGRFYEVQKYLSLTAHQWSGYWLIMNGDAWKSLPPDIQATVTKNAHTAAQKQRSAVIAANISLVNVLRGKGMTVNEADRSAMKAQLGNFYKTWKGEFGDKAWSLMESATGKLG